MIRLPYNACWLWSSLRIAKAYCLRNKTPEYLHSELIKRYINNEIFDITKYDETTIKEGDVDISNCGNAVEYLTLNGIYYNDSVIISNKNINMFKTAKYAINNYKSVYAILIQLRGHFQTVIKENNEYYLYDQSNNIGTKIKLNIVNNQLLVPIMLNFTILYFYNCACS